VTSTDRLATALIGLLAADGADAASLPCLAVAPPPDPAELERAVRRIATAHDGVVFSSPNGVRAMFDAVSRQGLDRRVLGGAIVAAIGPETSAALHERGVVADMVAQKARGEGLVELFRDRGLLCKRWLHVRADEGRAVLGRAIEAAGGRYELVVGYRTVRPELPRPLVCSLLEEDRGGDGVDALCFASGKAARHFLESTTEILGADDARACLANARIVSIGPVTTSALAALDIHVDATAEHPGARSMLDAVRDVLASGRGRGNGRTTGRLG
jgi:uroporphyrinogen III methyltransferase/synthase